jgi:hypothetical protein
MVEKGPVCKAVARPNTVQWKGQKNISLVEVDGIAEYEYSDFFTLLFGPSHLRKFWGWMQSLDKF